MWSGKKGSEGGAGTPTEEEIKVVLVGDTQCGKTSLVQRFVSDTFVEAYTPTGFEKYGYTCTVADYKVNFSVWDTSGTTAYDTVRPLAYQDAKIFMLCFNIAEPETLNNSAAKWYREVRTHGGSAPVLLCGCKADLRHDKETLTMLSKLKTHPVTSEEALSVARQLGATTYVETSARASSKGVRDAFEVAALAALGKLNKQQIKQQAYTPTGFEKYGYTCTVADYKVNFSVWDTSGTTAYDTVRPLAYQDAKIFMLCFNIAEPETLNNSAAKWYREVRTHGGSAPVLLCGCKADLRHDKETLTMLSKLKTHPVTSEEALSVARQLGATTYVETSARASSKGVRDAFEVAALAALGKLNKQQIKQQKQVGRSKSKRDLKAELKGRAKSCCVM